MKFYNLRGQYAHGMNRNASFRAGYRFSSGNFGYGIPGALSDNTTEHGVDVGVDYTRPLSKTRRLVFGFSLGSSSADVGTLSLGDDQIAGRQYKVIGDSSLGYQFHRTWQARVSYRKGLDYVPDLTQPVYVGGVTALVEGMLSRKLHFSSGGGYSSGDSALQRSATQFDTSTGYLRFQYIVSRNWATNAEYLYYYYNFTGVAALPLSVPHHLSRNFSADRCDPLDAVQGQVTMLPGRKFSAEDALHSVLRLRWLLLLPAVFGLVAGVGASSQIPKKYRSETLILVVPPRIPQEIVPT